MLETNKELASISKRALAGTGNNHPRPKRVCKSCKQKLPSPRNLQRLALLFAILEPALTQWPEDYEFQPQSTEHLRAWLLCKAHWAETRDLEIGGPSKSHAIRAVQYFMDSGKGWKFYKPTSKGIREYTPKSISFGKCREAEFKAVLNSITEILESIIGVPVEALIKERSAHFAEVQQGEGWR